MPSSQRYKYLLTGPTGQIGRYLLRELMNVKGSVAVVMRRQTRGQAENDLMKALGPLCHDEMPDVGITLGSITSCNLPEAEHIINAAGCTNLGHTLPTVYWNENILTAVRLAHHAKKTGASFHQLSSVAVAEFRPDLLTEDKVAFPDTRQTDYATSKVLVELSVASILPEAQFLRIGDVVPPISAMETDWRRSHWLPILFSCGKPGFQFAPDDYGVWLADVSELARSIMLLVNYPGGRYHLLGNTYCWSELRGHALEMEREGQILSPMVKWMTDIILHGPEARMVDDDKTRKLLGKEGFTWHKLDATYWKAFAERSVRRENEYPKYANKSA